MPGLNGTGPRGMGPMTGGGRGFCSPWGRGRNPGYPYYGVRPVFGYAGTPLPAMDRQQELDSLKRQAQQARGQLEEIEATIQRLANKE